MLSAAAICLALNVFYEARSEPIHGQYAVAFVTMNRVGDESSGNFGKVCETVFEDQQFSWTSNHKKPLKRYVKIAELARKSDEDSWNTALDIAHKVISKRSKDITHGATFFNEKKLGRRYKTNVAALKIGKHLFY